MTFKINLAFSLSDIASYSVIVTLIIENPSPIRKKSISKIKQEGIVRVWCAHSSTEALTIPTDKLG